MSPKKTPFLLLSLALIFIFACSLPTGAPEKKNDPNIVFTAAAQTASVQLTEAALTSSAMKTPLSNNGSSTSSLPTAQPTVILPTAAPTEEDDCNKVEFIADLTVPDGTIFSPNETFTKTWRIKNDGTCTWTTNYALVYDKGEQMDGATPNYLSGNVAPGQSVDISVNLTAPGEEGNYTGNWQMRNDENELFGKVYVQIKVVGGTFAVTSVKAMDAFYISGRGAALTAEITVNKGGKVSYYWILKEAGQANLTTVPEEITFDEAGTKEVSTLWNACPHAGNFTAYLYIDTPNHQEFGQAAFQCP